MSKLHGGNPTAWGASKLSLLKSWLPGAKHPAIWAAISRMVPVVFPGAEPTAFMGFCANGESLTANTTDSVAKQYFHEMGIFGTEGGARGGAVPNPDIHAKFNGQPQPNHWTPLHNNPDVRALLGGRNATMVDGAWKKACDDQCAIGLVNLRNQSRGIFRRFPSIAPTTEGSIWFVAMGFMSWSAGPGNTIKHLKPYIDQLAAVPEKQRWGKFMQLVAAGNPTGRRHANAAYSCARTAQKLEAGRLLQEFLGPVCSAWYDLQVDDQAGLYAKIAKLGYPG